MSVDLRTGDCLEVMRELEEASVDAVVTDPPYGLEFMGKDWDTLGTGRNGNPFDPKGPSFAKGGTVPLPPTPQHTRQRMPRCAHCGGWRYNAHKASECSCDKPKWITDTWTYPRKMQEWHEAWAREAFRVLKPGGHLLTFGGTRTYHRLACAVEDAGFEIRDTIAWMYGSGFPKSLDVSKAIDKRAEENGETTRRIALVGEVIRRYREVAGLTPQQVSEAVVGTPSGACWNWEHQQLPSVEKWPAIKAALGIPDDFDGLLEGDRSRFIAAERAVIRARTMTQGGGNALELRMGERREVAADVTAPATPDAAAWAGWGTALKPAHEPIVVARKPLTGTVATNVLEHGTGALNVDGCRVEADYENEPDRGPTWLRSGGGGKAFSHDAAQGPAQHREGSTVADRVSPLSRWPANVVLDEAWEPILCLTYNLSDDAWTILSEWCLARNRDLPPVRSEHRRAAFSSEAPEVLFAQVPAPVDEREPARGGAPDDGSPASAGIDREDAGDEAAESEAAAGGPLPESGLRLHSGAGGEAGPAGAPDRDGAGTRAAAEAGRDRTSRQRREGRQPAGESRAPRDAHAQDDARRALSGAAPPARPRREVLLRDVPADWLSFFEFTGDVANVGSARMLDEQTGDVKGAVSNGKRAGTGYAEGFGAMEQAPSYGDSGGASRFFYVAKASRAERNAGLEGFEERESGKLEDDIYEWATDGKGNPRAGKTRAANHHPTVKPVALMRWLVRLVTPPDGLVLDPFAGSGTTGIACALEGFRFLGIEREDDYARIAEARIAWWAEHGEDALRIVAERERADEERAAIAAAGQLDLLSEASA